MELLGILLNQIADIIITDDIDSPTRKGLDNIYSFTYSHFTQI